MKEYAAFLRGINVGTHNRVKMPDLKSALEAAGFADVRTYIQSGNLLFSSNDDESEIAKRIEGSIEGSFGFKAPAIMRTMEELKDIIEGCPFSRREAAEAQQTLGFEVLYVCLLSKTLTPQEEAPLKKYESEDESIFVSGKNVYLYVRKGIRESKAVRQLDKGGLCTIRNLNTMEKVFALSKESV